MVLILKWSLAKFHFVRSVLYFVLVRITVELEGDIVSAEKWRMFRFRRREWMFSGHFNPDQLLMLSSEYSTNFHSGFVRFLRVVSWTLPCFKRFLMDDVYFNLLVLKCDSESFASVTVLFRWCGTAQQFRFKPVYGWLDATESSPMFQAIWCINYCIVRRIHMLYCKGQGHL